MNLINITYDCHNKLEDLMKATIAERNYILGRDPTNRVFDWFPRNEAARWLAYGAITTPTSHERNHPEPIGIQDLI